MKVDEFIEDLESLCEQYWDKYAIDPTPKKNPIHNYDHSITIVFNDQKTESNHNLLAMIHPTVRRLYNEGVKNKEFNEQFKKMDSDYSKPNFLYSDKLKAAYALVYEGWLIAREEFDESKYD